MSNSISQFIKYGLIENYIDFKTITFCVKDETNEISFQVINLQNILQYKYSKYKNSEYNVLEDIDEYLSPDLFQFSNYRVHETVFHDSLKYAFGVFILRSFKFIPNVISSEYFDEIKEFQSIYEAEVITNLNLLISRLNCDGNKLEGLISLSKKCLSIDTKYRPTEKEIIDATENIKFTSKDLDNLFNNIEQMKFANNHLDELFNAKDEENNFNLNSYEENKDYNNEKKYSNLLKQTFSEENQIKNTYSFYAEKNNEEIKEENGKKRLSNDLTEDLKLFNNHEYSDNIEKEEDKQIHNFKEKSDKKSQLLNSFNHELEVNNNSQNKLSQSNEYANENGNKIEDKNKNIIKKYENRVSRSFSNYISHNSKKNTSAKNGNNFQVIKSFSVNLSRKDLGLDLDGENDKVKVLYQNSEMHDGSLEYAQNLINLNSSEYNLSQKYAPIIIEKKFSNNPCKKVVIEYQDNSCKASIIDSPKNCVKNSLNSSENISLNNKVIILGKKK